MIRRGLYYGIRFVLRIIRDLDGFFTWITTFWHPKTPLTGQCKQRGVCCQNIAVGLSHRMNRSRVIVTWVNAWYQFVYNFKLKGWYKNDAVLIYSCRYLSPQGRCTIYWRRPFICRQYPHRKRVGPTTMPGCGYRLVPPDPL